MTGNDIAVSRDEDDEAYEVDRINVSVDHQEDLEAFPDTEEQEVTFKTTEPGPSKRVDNQFDFLKGDVAFEKYIKSMVAKEMQKEKDKLTKSRAGNQGDMVKSPSDTTLYAPALAKTPDRTKQIVDSILNVSCVTPVTRNLRIPSQGEGNVQVVANDMVTDQIAHFIEGVRLEAQDQDRRPSPVVPPVRERRQSNLGEGQGQMTRQAVAGPSSVVTLPPDNFNSDVDAAKSRANKLVLDVERYKAVVNAPSGMLELSNPVNMVNMAGNVSESILPQNAVYAGPMVTEDDDFFHVTCHVDPVLRVKIEKGEFVDLKRLLPKQRGFFGSSGDDQRLNLIQKDGHAFFVPAQFSGKINGVRRWEQAFRVYAAIYSRANPTRAAEIWQYVHVINMAAATYVWDNVFYYDITFRHLMAQNPQRSWAKLYNNMWNLSMRETIAKGTGYNAFATQGVRHSGGAHGDNVAGGSGPGPKRKPRYCWAYGKAGAGNCKDGSKCKFVHRCSYCDEPDHYKNNCPKKGGNR